MGLLSSIFGGKSKLDAPAPDRLFAMTTAQVHLETALGIQHRSRAGIVFQSVDTADFASILSEAEELLRGTTEELGTSLRSFDDEFGYRWLVLEDPDFEDLVVALNTIAGELQGGGYGDRLLACVFAFEKEGRPLYLIYNFKRGTFYPFIPSGEKSRDTERELQLRAQIGPELPLEEDTSRWFPLWEVPL